MKYSTWKPFEIENLKKSHRAYYDKQLTYKQLCDALGIKVKSGISREHQLEDLQCVYDLEVYNKGWTKYILHGYRGIEYLPTPETLQDIEYALLQLLSEQDLAELWYTDRQLLEQLNLVNLNFDVLLNKDFYDRFTDEMKEMVRPALAMKNMLVTYVKRALERLEERCIVSFCCGYGLIRITPYKGLNENSAWKNKYEQCKKIDEVKEKDFKKRLNDIAVSKCLKSKQLNVLDEKNLREKFVEDVIRVPSDADYLKQLLPIILGDREVFVYL